MNLRLFVPVVNRDFFQFLHHHIDSKNLICTVYAKFNMRISTLEMNKSEVFQSALGALAPRERVLAAAICLTNPSWSLTPVLHIQKMEGEGEDKESSRDQENKWEDNREGQKMANTRFSPTFYRLEDSTILKTTYFQQSGSKGYDIVLWKHCFVLRCQTFFPPQRKTYAEFQL